MKGKICNKKVSPNHCNLSLFSIYSINTRTNRTNVVQGEYTKEMKKETKPTIIFGSVWFDSFGEEGRGGNIINLTCLVKFLLNSSMTWAMPSLLHLVANLRTAYDAHIFYLSNSISRVLVDFYS